MANRYVLALTILLVAVMTACLNEVRPTTDLPSESATPPETTLTTVPSPDAALAIPSPDTSQQATSESTQPPEDSPEPQQDTEEFDPVEAISEPIQTLSDIFSAKRIVLSAFMIFLAWLTALIVSWLFKVASIRFPRYRLQFGLLLPVSRLLIWTVAIVTIVFGILSPSPQTLLAASAGIGLTLGLASQDLVRNHLAGILMLIDRPFRVGDMIRIGEQQGEVTNIGLRSIQIRTFDDNIVTLPNSMVMSQVISNANSGELSEMVTVDFSLPASLNVSEIKDMAWEAAASSPYTYLRKPITVNVEDRFNRTFLTGYRVKVYVLDIRYERVLATDVQERIKRELISKGLLNESTVLGILGVGSNGGIPD